jgi:dTDP-4-dehydrorhamnose reductase
MNKPKLLVTGASGFLGGHVCAAATEEWQVYGTVWRHPVVLPGSRVLRVDVTDFAALKQVFQTLRPDAVIHLAAQSQPNACQRDPQGTHAINVTAAGDVAGLCSDRAIPCVLTSTDLVFDGQHAPYRETDAVAPVNVYGEQKVAAEQAMLQRYPATVVCRMPLMFGTAQPPAQSFIQSFIATLQAGEELSLFMDEFRTPVSGPTAAQGLLLALDLARDQRLQGTLHLGGKTRISRYEFGRLMAEVLQLPSDRLRACRQSDVPMAAPRPPDVSLDSRVAFGLGYAPPGLAKELVGCRG